MTDQPFSLLQMKTIKYIMGIVETGSAGGNPALLVILQDRAGITFGRHQTTENGGGLWHLLFEYYLPTAQEEFREYFSPFQEILYKAGKDGVGRKNAVTGNQKF